MKRLLPVLMGLALLLVSSTEGWSLPPCANTTANSMQETQGRDNCFGNLYFETGRFKGDKYVGEFKDGKRHGQGTLTLANGNKYVGEWKNGKYHGQGTFTFPSGEKHVGKWKNQLPNGQGVHTYTDGRIEEGIFENGIFLDTKKPSPTN